MIKQRASKNPTIGSPETPTPPPHCETPHGGTAMSLTPDHTAASRLAPRSCQHMPPRTPPDWAISLPLNLQPVRLPCTESEAACLALRSAHSHVAMSRLNPASLASANQEMHKDNRSPLQLQFCAKSQRLGRLMGSVGEVSDSCFLLRS